MTSTRRLRDLRRVAALRLDILGPQTDGEPADIAAKRRELTARLAELDAELAARTTDNRFPD